MRNARVGICQGSTIASGRTAVRPMESPHLVCSFTGNSPRLRITWPRELTKGPYRTSFNLNVPAGVDYPLALLVSNSTSNTHYRAQFYVNGYQFGKYVNSIGPQRSFPVREYPCSSQSPSAAPAENASE